MLRVAQFPLIREYALSSATALSYDNSAALAALGLPERTLSPRAAECSLKRSVDVIIPQQYRETH